MLGINNFGQMAPCLSPYTNSSELDLILRERSRKERNKSVLKRIGYVLPEEVIIEILSWLPVKTLLQFKTVCKSWYAIIASPDFISKHLENYYNNNDSDCLLAQFYESRMQVYMLLLDETPPTLLAFTTLQKMPISDSKICGPCNGLYYLYLWDGDYRALWNPTISELKHLPPIITKPNLPSNITYSPPDIYGFGLDPIAKDYKVIVIKSYSTGLDSESDSVEETETRYRPSVFVYSLKTDSWRYWGDLTKFYDIEDNNTCYICSNGVFYWLGSYKKGGYKGVIISFDMVTDASQEIRLPDYGNPTAAKSLSLYHESVALFIVHDMADCFDIWTLNKGCWTKNFTVKTFFKFLYCSTWTSEGW